MLLSLSVPSLAPVLLPAPWLLSLLSSTRFLYHLFSVSLLSPAPPLPPSGCPLLLLLLHLSLACASLLAADVTEAEAEATLPSLAAIHKFAQKGKKRRKAGGKIGWAGGWVRGGGVLYNGLTSQ